LNPGTIISLDWPLQKRNTKEAEEEECQRKLPINLRWAKETATLWQKHCPDMNLLIPIQARTPEQFEKFMEGLSGLKFSGVSIPYRNMRPDFLVAVLVRLNQLRIPWVHLLGTTAFGYLGIAAFFARQGFFELISADSSSWKAAGMSSAYMSPHNLLSCQLKDGMIIPEGIRNDCRCPFCRNMSFEDIAFEPYGTRSLFLLCHNAWVTQQVATELFRNSRSLSQLSLYMKSKKSSNQKEVDRAIAALGPVEDVIRRNGRRVSGCPRR